MRSPRLSNIHDALRVAPFVVRQIDAHSREPTVGHWSSFLPPPQAVLALAAAADARNAMRFIASASDQNGPKSRPMVAPSGVVVGL